MKTAIKGEIVKKSIDEHLKNKKYRSFKTKNVLKHSVCVC